MAAADATALDRLYPEGWGNSNRHVRTVFAEPNAPVRDAPTWIVYLAL